MVQIFFSENRYPALKASNLTAMALTSGGTIPTVRMTDEHGVDIYKEH